MIALKRSLAVFGAVLILAAAAAPARAEDGWTRAIVKNATPTCLWLTVYTKGGVLYNIVPKPHFVHPGKETGTNTGVASSVRVSVEMTKNPDCSGGVVQRIINTYPEEDRLADLHVQVRENTTHLPATGQYYLNH
jgi:hypothetical protein